MDRFHFPNDLNKENEEENNLNEENEEKEEEEESFSFAERLQRKIMSAGVLQNNVSGNVIVEFGREMGTFVTPRGRYNIQMTSSFFRMQGAQYDYKINYSDISALFLLPKPDDVRTAFVIALDKPIRQGNQKYKHLVLETHRLEQTIPVNLTEEEIASKYDNQLSASLTMPMCNLFAKVFKILAQSSVFVPKHFLSDRKTHCVKCSLKANEGLLYPLSKSFIFIHKPTLIINFDDVESVEFQRYKQATLSATKNFDMLVTVGKGVREVFNFSGIDRSEYGNLQEFLSSKKLKLKEEEDVVRGPALDWSKDDENEGDDDGDSEDEDDDYGN